MEPKKRTQDELHTWKPNFKKHWKCDNIEVYNKDGIRQSEWTIKGTRVIRIDKI